MLWTALQTRYNRLTTYIADNAPKWILMGTAIWYFVIKPIQHRIYLYTNPLYKVEQTLKGNYFFDREEFVTAFDTLTAEKRKNLCVQYVINSETKEEIVNSLGAKAQEAYKTNHLEPYQFF